MHPTTSGFTAFVCYVDGTADKTYIHSLTQPQGTAPPGPRSTVCAGDRLHNKTDGVPAFLRVFSVALGSQRKETLTVRYDRV